MLSALAAYGFSRMWFRGRKPRLAITLASTVVPLSRPVAAESVFVVIGVWNTFLWPFIVANNPDLMTLPVGVANVRCGYGLEYAQNSAAAFLAALPLLVVILFQRQIVRGVATTGLGGQ